ncbi:tripartite tricarboxylate transporter permease [Spiractinospora alimapuensis]|uniref:tripartite tricarboxylate transporter permease n=1 Tax=Spiractinospora alimapuensis TaxID=2820884 RepID=UPI001F344E29|nr:tripartite tricarboxylate transporter permease [Spiractinospora alimapuensis]QVQ50910.1 tripartite tricarboxylate transporter permease [Spiractinospora alimapuensis]
MEGVLDGLAMLTPQTFLWMFVGVALCQVVVIIPGLSAHLVLALILPFLYTMDPASAIGLLIGAAATSGTGNTITAVLFAVPGSPAGIATLFDGHPMAQRGEAGRAILAGLISSALGGVVGSVVLVLFLPLAYPLVTIIGPSELFILALLALAFLAFLGDGNVVKGLAAGGLGLLIAFIGQESSTGALRYTFGQLSLWDGISIAAVAIGLFGVAEMLELIARGGAIANTEGATYRRYPLSSSFRDLAANWRTVLQSSALGSLIGLLPGIGGASSQFVAYGAAKRTSKHKEEFGKGRIEGVIAADASVNATDSASLAPSLALGIPGSPITALVLAGVVIIGVRPGPDLLTDNVAFLWLVIFVLVIANVIGVALCVMAIRPLARLTFVPAVYLVPPILAFALFGVVEADGSFASIPVVLALGVLGYLMKKHGYSRATLIIGFVLADLLERNLLLALSIDGPAFLLHSTPALIIIGLAVAALTFAGIRGRRKKEKANVAHTR